MQKLVLILIAFIAVVTFIRAFDNTGAEVPEASGVSIDISEHSSENFDF